MVHVEWLLEPYVYAIETFIYIELSNLFYVYMYMCVGHKETKTYICVF